MKKAFIISCFIFISLASNQNSKVNADTITNIYAFAADYSSTFAYTISPFDTSLGNLNEVNVSIRGYSVAYTFNPTFPYLNEAAGPVVVSHQFTTIGDGIFDSVLPASIMRLGTFINPVDLLYYTNLDLSFSFFPNIPTIPTAVGYTAPPLISGDIEGFKDTNNVVPPLMLFQQFVNYHPVYVYPSSQIFMQIDYVYTPSGPTIINPIGTIQIDPVTSSLFSNITSVQQISDDQLYALAMSAVPEPTTMMLFGIGLLGIAGVSRKKK